MLLVVDEELGDISPIFMFFKFTVNDKYYKRAPVNIQIPFLEKVDFLFLSWGNMVFS